MKKSSIVISFASSVLLCSCLKDKSNVDFSDIGTVAEISTASTNGTDQAPSGGLAFFTGAVIATTVDATPDDEFFTVNIASQYPPTKDIPVTVAINDAARTAYNASTPDYTYGALPTNAYSFPATTGTVHAGLRLDTFNITFMHGNMDPTKDYMLPISLTAAPGATISGNLNTVYFHIVGNLLALNYKQTYSRWDAADSTGVAAAVTTLPDSTFFTPLTPFKNEFKSGFTDAQTTKLRYDISFVRTGNTASTFSLAFNATDVKNMQKAGDTVKTGPSIINANFATGTYRLGYQVKTPGGVMKYVIDNFQR